MNPWLVVVGIASFGSVAVLATALGWTLFRSRGGTARPPGERSPLLNQAKPGDAVAACDLARYQVMERLLAPRDVEFLARQKGLPASLTARWKRDSVRIFRMYLKELTRDFHTLHAQARQMVAESHAESPAFAATLVRQQIAFWRARATLEAHLILFRMGAGRVEVAPLLDMIEAMRVDLFRLIPQTAEAL